MRTIILLALALLAPPLYADEPEPLPPSGPLVQAPVQTPNVPVAPTEDRLRDLLSAAAADGKSGRVAYGVAGGLFGIGFTIIGATSLAYSTQREYTDSTRQVIDGLVGFGMVFGGVCAFAYGVINLVAPISYGETMLRLYDSNDPKRLARIDDLLNNMAAVERSVRPVLVTLGFVLGAVSLLGLGVAIIVPLTYPENDPSAVAKQDVYSAQATAFAMGFVTSLLVIADNAQPSHTERLWKAWKHERKLTIGPTGLSAVF